MCSKEIEYSSIPNDEIDRHEYSRTRKESIVSYSLQFFFRNHWSNETSQLRFQKLKHQLQLIEKDTAF